MSFKTVCKGWGGTTEHAIANISTISRIPVKSLFRLYDEGNTPLNPKPLDKALFPGLDIPVFAPFTGPPKGKCMGDEFKTVEAYLKQNLEDYTSFQLHEDIGIALEELHKVHRKPLYSESDLTTTSRERQEYVHMALCLVLCNYMKEMRDIVQGNHQADNTTVPPTPCEEPAFVTPETEDAIAPPSAAGANIVMATVNPPAGSVAPSTRVLASHPSLSKGMNGGALLQSLISEMQEQGADEMMHDILKTRLEDMRRLTGTIDMSASNLVVHFKTSQPVSFFLIRKIEQDKCPRPTVEDAEALDALFDAGFRQAFGSKLTEDFFMRYTHPRVVDLVKAYDIVNPLPRQEGPSL